jgi:CBS domain-containing protein
MMTSIPEHGVTAIAHAPVAIDRLAGVLVGEVMHPGVLSCTPDTPLPALAGIMATHGVHAVAIAAVDAESSGRGALVVGALDLVRVLLQPEPGRLGAGKATGREVPVVGSRETLARAARTMADRGASHALVGEGPGRMPAGVLSTLDVLAVLGGVDAIAAHVRPAPQPLRAARGLDGATVGDMMRPGIITCAPETAIVDVARVLAHRRVHAIAVLGPARGGGDRERPVWRIVDALDVLRAAVAGWAPDRMADELGTTRPATVGVHESMRRAARRMADLAAQHLVAVSGSGLPVGIVSTLDVMAACRQP